MAKKGKKKPLTENQKIERAKFFLEVLKWLIEIILKIIFKM